MDSQNQQSGFVERYQRALHDPQLQRALSNVIAKTSAARSHAMASASDDWERLRQRAHQIKEHTINNLDYYLEQFALNVERQGGNICWANDAAEANLYITNLARERGARLAVKGKSMMSEEIELNSALKEAGIEALETDLGEFIVQLAGERPSHINMPAIHKTRRDVADLFTEKLKFEHTEEIPRLAGLARQLLRERFAAAEIGITGVNFAVAETGTIVLVENEGNIRMTTSLPRLHVAIMSIEKIIPSLADLTVFLQLLPLSASGQKAVSYVSLLTGVKRLASEEGPEEFHLVILDNGRSNMLANPHLRESLYCIRCGACLNSCPVYQKIGGHAYGWVYPGPIGAVLTPQLIGRQKAKDLPFASSLCGACYEVCPVKINIPQMLLHLRSEIKEGIDTAEHIAPDSNVSNQELSTLAWLKRGIRHTAEHSAFRAWARIMSSERSYRRYLGFSELVQRLDLTFESLHKLPRYRGHYLNWYDTQTLQPVAPHYISTVDSGNLAGHLIAVEQACLELADQPLFGARIIDGLSDVVALLAEANCGRMPVVREEINSCAKLLTGGAPATAGLWLSLFASLEHRAAKIRSLIPKIERDDLDELCFWANALEQSAHSLRIELETFVPTIAPRTAELTQVIERCSKEAASSWRCLIGDLDRIPSASQLAGYCNLALSRLAALRVQLEHSEPYDPMDQERMLTGVNQLTRAFEVAAAQAGQLLSRLTHFAHTSKRLVDEMDLSFLYNEERNVFSIGYDISKDQTDDYFYDLLASEARLSSFVAIAKGSAPQQHWFRLGRGLTSTRNGLVLVSWAATMFEYLMPLLVMRSYEKTLLDESNRVALARHIEYAQEQGIPWGMSESSCFARDINDNYQYGTFGVPGLGIKRGLSEDLVVTPYASLLAVMVVPTAALENLRRLEQEGALGRYGFYEAVDYTPGRLPLNSTHEIVRVFMAHHQGMSLLALDNLLNNNVMQRRFHASPLVRATELLLQERIPCGVAPVRLRPEEVWAKRKVVRRRTAAKRKPGTDRFHKQELYIPNGAQ